MGDCKFEIRIHTPCFSLYDWAIAQPDPPTYQQALDKSGWTLEKLQIALNRIGLGIGIANARVEWDELGNEYSVESLDGLEGMYILATNEHVRYFQELNNNG